ncbi:putative Ig domain-containing protein [Actinoplanes sp. NPDC051859]|uniref:putative Ig domain-containing protein n=1 Tax=Actinoplanes sp. NPDC051859 TaxID=3363909 RepID=UPI0037B5F8A1
MLRQEPRSFVVRAVRDQGRRPRRLVTLTLACVLAVLTQFLTVPPASAAGTVTVTSPGGQAGPTGVAFAKAMTASGGTAPYLWSATGLPPGLTIDASSGLISGTPATAGSYPTKVTATDSTGVAGFASFSFATGVIVTYPSSRASNIGTAIAPLALKAAGGTGIYTWTSTGLPAGLSIDATTGVVTGTPTTAGVHSVKITATDGAGVSGATGFTWTVAVGATVADPGPIHATIDVPVSKQMAATGGKAPYWWAATGLPAGLSIKSSTGLISGTPTTAVTGPVLVTATDAANVATTISVPFTVAALLKVTDPGTRNDPSGSPVSVALAATGGTAPYTWNGSGLPAGLSLNSTSGVISGTPTTLASHTATVTVTDAGLRTHTASFSWNVVAPITVANPYGQVGPTGVDYTKALAASGGTAPYRWTATGLPIGLTLDPATGTISGTPTTAGNYTPKVTVTDRDGNTGSVSFSFATGVIVTYPSSRGSAIGTAITPLTIKAAGGTGNYAWTATGLPPGLIIDTATGVVTGTPTTNGVYSATITATDTTGTSGATGFTWTIAAAATITHPGTVHATTGVAMARQLSATGGKAPYTWAATGLPAGLSIKSSTGLISGTATTAATTTVSVTVTDALKITSTLAFPIAVGAPVTIASPGTHTSTASAAIADVRLSADGGTAPFTWIVSGLPAGLTATATGTITGTPSSATTSVVTATVVDAAGRTATTSFTWNIAGPVALADPGAQTGTIGVATSLQLAAIGGTGGYRWSVAGLPTGLSLDATTGQVTGTPTATGSWPVTVTVTDASGSTARTIVTWTTADALAATDPGAQNTTVGEQTHLPLTAGGGTAPYTWTVHGLRAGLTFDPASGAIAGSPTNAGTSTVTVTVVDAAGRTDRAMFLWTVALAVPGGLTAEATEPQTVALSWSAVPGATAYRIYRDGALVATTGSDTGLFDRQLDGATGYRYRVIALGADNLESVPSDEAAVTTMPTPAAPENYAACKQSDTDTGCTYTVSTLADPALPSHGQFPLTDGVHGGAAAGPAWQGRHNQNSYSFTVDLGINRPLTEITTTWLQDRAAGIQLPLTVAYALSTDAQEFTDIATVSRPNVSAADQVRAYRAVGLNQAARYVRVTVNGAGAWTLVDEIEARGSTADILPALTLSTPTPAPIDQDKNVPVLNMTVAEAVGTLSWRADGLPDGLAIDPATGVITGTARAAGAYTVTVTAASTKGRIGYASFPMRVYPSAPTGPVFPAGVVDRFSLGGVNRGVTVLDGNAYTAVGTRIVETSPTGLSVWRAGQTTAGCTDDADDGDKATFSLPHVIGNDGNRIYVADYGCGVVRKVNPHNGATEKVISAETNGDSHAIVGRYLYVNNKWGSLIRHDLEAGERRVLTPEGQQLLGKITADDNYVWLLTNNKIYRLNNSGPTTSPVFFGMPFDWAGQLVSVGDFLYFSSKDGTKIYRMNKSDGATRFIAGDGANGDLLYGITGFAASAGSRLYVSDEQGLAAITAAPARSYAPAPASPELTAGHVQRFGPSNPALHFGVTVLDGYAYTAVDGRITKTDIDTGATVNHAGSTTMTCLDAPTGQAATFENSQIIGNDGTLIYTAHWRCGVRAVNPSTGATRKIVNAETNGDSYAIVGPYLYVSNKWGSLIRHDLQTGERRVLNPGGQQIGGKITADDNYVWLLTNNKIYRLNNSGPTINPASFAMPFDWAGQLISVGDVIYFSSQDGTKIYRMNKSDGAVQLIAGDGADGDFVYGISGFAAAGARLYVSDDRGLAAISPAPARVYPSAPPAPVLNSGRVNRFGPDQWTKGITVIDGVAYTAVDKRIVRTDTTTGASEDLAGGTTSGCADAVSGSATFTNPRIIGNDGFLIYTADYNCGVRATNPNTGATRKIINSETNGDSYAIVGQYLYVNNSSGSLIRHDLQTGERRVLTKPGQEIYGPITADDTHVWVLDPQARLHGIDVTTMNGERRRLEIPSGLWHSPLSVGDYIYVRSHNDTILRISKTTGSTQLVAGDGAHRDDLLSLVNGIATDGIRLYASDQLGLAAIIEAVRPYTPPAPLAPNLSGAAVTTVASLPGARWGLTILDDFIYTANASQIFRTTRTGSTVPAAGNAATISCRDGATRDDATFRYPTIIGNDGNLIYTSESCGIRAVNPATGSARIISSFTGRSVIAGEHLYTLTDYGTLYQYGLRTGTTNTVSQNITAGSTMTADRTHIWLINGTTLKSLPVTDTDGKVSATPIGGTITTVTNTLPYPIEPGYMTTTGDKLYVKAYTPDHPAKIAEISKSGAMSLQPAGLWTGTNGGIVATESDVVTLDTGASTTDVRRLRVGAISPYYQLVSTQYINDGTLFVPSSHLDEAWLFNAEYPRVLEWDPETQLCVSQCQGIIAYAQQRRIKAPAFGNSLDDYERLIIKEFVENQGKFEFGDGSIAEAVKEYYFQDKCRRIANRPGYCEDLEEIRKHIETFETILDIVSSVADFLGKNFRGGHSDCVRIGKGCLTITGKEATPEEVAAAEEVAKLGNAVVLRDPPQGGGTRGVNTSDLLVNGKQYDIYSPKTKNLDRIASNIKAKRDQVEGGGVVLNLRNSELKASEVDAEQLLARANGAPSEHPPLREIIVVE